MLSCFVAVAGRSRRALRIIHSTYKYKVAGVGEREREREIKRERERERDRERERVQHIYKEK